MAESSRTLVGTTEDIIDQILSWICAGCSREACCLPYARCDHLQNLAKLLPISKLWFEIVVKILWEKYVTWDALQGLVCGSSSNPVSSTSLDSFDMIDVILTPSRFQNTDTENWIMPQHLKLWERYSRYITHLEFGHAFDDIPFNGILISFLELGALSHNKPLLPRITSLIIRDWYALKGFHLLVGLFLSSPSITKIALDFDERPLSQQVFRNMSIIAQNAPTLRSLSVHYHMRLPPPQANQCPLRDSLNVLEAMRSLEELAIDPVSINLTLFDAIGELKHLKSLKLRGYPTASEFMSSNSVASIRSAGKFPVLESLDVEDKVTTVNGILNTYFSAPNHPLNALLVTISHGPMTERHFATLETSFKRCEKLHIIFNNHQNEALTKRHLSCLSDCKSLTEFVVTHPSHISVAGTEISEIFKSCTNLRILRLRMSRKRNMTYAEYKQVLQDQNPRLDISCLDVFAATLPHLRHLELSVLACDTSRLPSGRTLSAFKRLETLHLSDYSLLNWNVIPFDQHQAAGYISALLRPETDFRCPPYLLVSLANTGNGQRSESRVNFDNFIRGFEEQVTNYVQIRTDQTERIERGRRGFPVK
jgi:hypothetical protein